MACKLLVIHEKDIEHIAILRGVDAGIEHRKRLRIKIRRDTGKDFFGISQVDPHLKALTRRGEPGKDQGLGGLLAAIDLARMPGNFFGGLSQEIACVKGLPEPMGGLKGTAMQLQNALGLLPFGRARLLQRGAGPLGLQPGRGRSGLQEITCLSEEFF